MSTSNNNQQIVITVGEMVIHATPLATETAQALCDAMPCSAPIQTWGKEIFFQLPLDIQPESTARDVVEAGELAYWPDGGCVAIGFGPTPASRGGEIRLVAPVNIWGTADPAAVRQLKQASDGDTVTMEVARAGET